MLLKFCNRIIQYSFYLLFFLVPLIMTPFNYELFEFNKMILVYALTVVIATVWLIKMVLAKKILFQRTPLDIPILFFSISQFLSFFLSIDRYTSLWGYYGRFHGGFLSTLSYITLYYAFVSNIRDVIHYLKIILASGFLVATYGILEHFGIDSQYWVQDVKTRVFSTIGQPNWLAAYLVVISPLSWAFALKSKVAPPSASWRTFSAFAAASAKEAAAHGKSQNVKLQSSIFYFLSSIFYLCLLFTRSRSGFLGFWLANIVFLVLLSLIPFITREFKTKGLVFINLVFILITFFIGTPFEKLNRYFSWQGLTSHQLPAIMEGGTESGEIRRIVWQGAVDIWQHYPIFGSGPETFAYSYYQYRPKEHNLTSEWDFLYNKAHNEYLNFLATTGLVGLVGYLSFVGGFIYWSVKKILSKNPSNILISQYLNIALFSGWFSILITNFFGFSVVPVALFFFLLPAMSFTLVAQPEKPIAQPFNLLTIRQLSSFQKISLILLLYVACCMLLVIGKLWFADASYARGRELNKMSQYDLALNKLKTAINLNPGEPVYKDEISVSLAYLAFLAHQQNLEALSTQLAQQAVSFSDQAIEVSPYNLNFWKGRAKIFYTLSQIDQKYLENASLVLTTAHMLAPTDAKIAYNLGLVLGQIGQNDQAIEVLEKTIELKPDYRNARYGLALFYHEADFDQAAIGQLEYILEKIATDDGEVREKLEEWKGE